MTSPRPRRLPRAEQSACPPLPSKEGTTEKVLRTFIWKPRPEPGLDFHALLDTSSRAHGTLREPLPHLQRERIFDEHRNRSPHTGQAASEMPMRAAQPPQSAMCQRVRLLSRGERKSLLNLWRRTVNVRRPKRAPSEGTTRPKRLDDTRCTTYERRINYRAEASQECRRHLETAPVDLEGFLAH